MKTTLLSLSAVCCTLANSHAASLFADNFNRADDTDLNDLTTGKSGTLGALDWVEKNLDGDAAIVSNKLNIGENFNGGGWAIAYVDHNFTGVTSLTISFDLLANSSSGGTRFTGIAVGHSKTEMDNWSTNQPTSFDSDFFFGYDTTSTNEVKVFKNGGTQDYQQGIDLDAGGALSVTFSSITDFNSGSTVTYEAFINTNSVKTGSFTWSGTNENYLGLYSNYTTNNGAIDNFEVSGTVAVPEPSSAALLGLGGLALVLRRRKQSHLAK